MSTLYSLEDDAPEVKVIDKMRRDVKPNGEKVFSFATGFQYFSLRICNAVYFYTRSSLQRKPKLEMDSFTGDHDDRIGIFCVHVCISNLKIMDSSLLLQYIVVLLVVAFACYSLFRILRKNFAPKKFNSREQTVIRIAVVHNFLMGCDK